jgi:hypothetical protein
MVYQRPDSLALIRKEGQGLATLLEAHYDGCPAPSEVMQNVESAMKASSPVSSAVIPSLQNDSRAEAEAPFLLAVNVSRSERARKPILWIHLHNFAGTYVCMEASRQSEVVPPASGWPGCLYGNDLCSAASADRVHCQDRVQSAYSFSMIERDLADADICDDILLGTMLRDPLSGVRSTLVANSFNKQELLSIFSGEPSRMAEHMPCLPRWDSFQHFDNFATRSLGKAYWRAPRQVQRVDLEKAKESLQRMDVVMILEELPDHIPQLEATFGWNPAAMEPQQKAYGHDCHAVDDALNDTEQAFFRELNSLDYELYAFARELAANRTATANAAIASRPAQS